MKKYNSFNELASVNCTPQHSQMSVFNELSKSFARFKREDAASGQSHAAACELIADIEDEFGELTAQTLQQAAKKLGVTTPNTFDIDADTWEQAASSLRAEWKAQAELTG